MPRESKCPFCSGEVLPKMAGRAFASISAFSQRSFNVKIPTEFLSKLAQNVPVSKASIFKDGCPVCGGKGSIKDPSDDSDKYEQVKQIAMSKAEELLDLESKLAPPCGNRYTVIQGCDLLEVGLGMNTSPSYRVDRDKSIRSKGLVDPGKIDSEIAGPQIPEGATANHVQGLNPLPSPGGHYMIKCSNKFTLLTGSQGVDITTGGPLTISGGITRITAPEIVIGTQTGRLSLNGDVVDISGRSVEISPTDGHLFVKGTISSTGNLMVGGSLHAESLSFVKAECTGRNEMTKPAAPSDLHTGPAFWGGIGVEGIKAAMKDLVGFVASKTSNPVEAQQIMTTRFSEGLRDKMLNLTYHMRPWETKATGYILPGTRMLLQGTVPCNQGGTAGGIITATVISPIDVNNFPHSHALPDLEHCHEVRVPDLDYSSDSAAEVRGKQGGVASSAPLHKKTGGAQGIMASLFQPISTIFTPIWKGIQGSAGPFQK